MRNWLRAAIAVLSIATIATTASLRSRPVPKTDDCCTQVAVNQSRIATLEQRMTAMESWRDDHVGRTTQDGMARIQVLERTVEVHQQILMGLGSFVGLAVLGAILRLVLKRGSGHT